MQIGIDWVSTGIFLAAYVFAQIRTVPLKLRYGVLAAACAAIAVLRLRMGTHTFNLVFVGIAAALCLYYAVKVATSHDRPKVSHGDDD